MKKFRPLILLVILITCIVSLGNYFPDVIITSPDGVWTDTRAFSSINAAVTAIGANERDLFVVREETTTSLTIPDNITVHFLRYGSIANTGQLQVNAREIKASDRQIFTGTGDIDFVDGFIARSAWFSDIHEAIDVTSDDVMVLVISDQDNLDTSVAVGNDVILKWESTRNRIVVDSGITLSNVHTIEAGRYQLFAGAGDIDFADGTFLRLSWFRRLRSVATWIENEYVTLLIDESQDIEYSRTLPSNISIEYISGNVLTLDPGVTFGIEGPVDWKATKLFDRVNTTARVDLSESPSQGVPVEAFGVYADGTDHSEELQFAADAAWSLKFSLGSYDSTDDDYVAKDVNIYPYHYLKGEGAGTEIRCPATGGTIFKLNNDYPPGPMYPKSSTGRARSNIFEKIRFQGPNAWVLGARAGYAACAIDGVTELVGSGIRDIIIKDCDFLGFPTYAVQLNASYVTSIDNCHFEGNGVGLYLYGTTLGGVNSSTFANNGVGIFGFYSNGLSIDGGQYIEGNRYAGILLVGSLGVTMTGGYFEQNGWAGSNIYTGSDVKLLPTQYETEGWLPTQTGASSTTTLIDANANFSGSGTAPMGVIAGKTQVVNLAYGTIYDVSSVDTATQLTIAVATNGYPDASHQLMKGHPYLLTAYSSTVTTGSSTKLIDTNSNFVSGTGNLNTDYNVYNTTTGSMWAITAIDSPTQLSISNIRPGTDGTRSMSIGDTYVIGYPNQNTTFYGVQFNGYSAQAYSTQPGQVSLEGDQHTKFFGCTTGNYTRPRLGLSERQAYFVCHKGLTMEPLFLYHTGRYSIVDLSDNAVQIYPEYSGLKHGVISDGHTGTSPGNSGKWERFSQRIDHNTQTLLYPFQKDVTTKVAFTMVFTAVGTDDADYYCKYDVHYDDNGFDSNATYSNNLTAAFAMSSDDLVVTLTGAAGKTYNCTTIIYPSYED